MTSTQHQTAAQAQRLIPHRIADQNWAPDAKAPVDFNTGQMSLNRHAETLLGVPAGKRSVRIMVTMPSTGCPSR
jgi:hypothetical protein